MLVHEYMKEFSTNIKARQLVHEFNVGPGVYVQRFSLTIMLVHKHMYEFLHILGIYT